jgi:hypothetical protein
MSKTSVLIAGVNVCVAGESVTVVGLASGNDGIIPSFAFFPSLATSVRVASIGRGSFESQGIASIIIPRNAESLCPSCFSNCGSLSSISFESDSQLIALNQTHSVIMFVNQLQFLETWRLFVYHVL